MDSLEKLIEILSSMPLFEDFMTKNPQIKNIESLVYEYKQYLQNKGIFNSELDIMLKIILEKSQALKSKIFNISYLNKNLQIDDTEILNEFLEDRHKCARSVPESSNNQYHKIDDLSYKYENAEKQHYKTKTETIVRTIINYSQEIVDKYLDCTHPYICNEIGAAFCNAKIYYIGLPFLQKALFNVFSSVNIFWDNPYAIYGCAEALYELQHLLGREGMIELSSEYYLEKPIFEIVLKLIYLYLSRAAYIEDERLSEYLKTTDRNKVPDCLIRKINYLSSRADILYAYRNEFANFWFLSGVNPDIQFMSDKALAHNLSEEVGLSIVTKQAFWDSLKMYQHGSLIPNASGGYKDSEEATYPELIERGRMRSFVLAEQIYQQYKNGDFALSKSEIAVMFEYLRNKFM